MRQKHLESMLSSAKQEFDHPNVTLEQYPTSPLLTAATVLAAGEDVGEGRTVLDLGCGTGMLALACALLDTDTVIAVDCDRNALGTAKENAEQLEVGDRILFVQAQVATRPRPNSSTSKKTPRGRKPQQQKQPDALPPCNSGFPLPENFVDTVLTNPPFGTKHNQGMDMQFLELGCHLAKRAVYSFHKTSTRAFVLRTIEKKTGCPAKVVAEMKFDLGRTYKFHKNKSVDVDVDLIRVDVSQKPSAPYSEEKSQGNDCVDT